MEKKQNCDIKSAYVQSTEKLKWEVAWAMHDEETKRITRDSSAESTSKNEANFQFGQTRKTL